MTVRASDLAERLGGHLRGDGNREVGGVTTPELAGPRDLVFIDTPGRAPLLATTRAGVALVPVGTEAPASLTTIEVRQPAGAMAIATDLLVPTRRSWRTVSPQAFVAPTAHLDDGVGVGPFAVIGDDVRIGAGTEIHANVTVGAGTVIGRDCLLYSGVHVYDDTTIGDRVILHSGAVIGADGFGYAQVRADTGDATDEAIVHRKIRQVGRVVLEDDVEVGANATIDRAALGETRIGRGTKIDNLVTVGHNVRIGRHCILVAQSGVSGSTVLEDYVRIAGQAGLTGHLRLGRGATVGAQAGVTKDIAPGAVVLGSPAIDARRAKLALALLDRLPEMKRALGDHARRLLALESGPATNRDTNEVS
jgi:UDP-3-O-[3-hydroxymyristoyl] glucosamine N-acyltransferase